MINPVSAIIGVNVLELTGMVAVNANQYRNKRLSPTSMKHGIYTVSNQIVQELNSVPRVFGLGISTRFK